MIGSLFILNEKGSVLFEKHYRRVSSRACCEDFWKMIERRAGEQLPPVVQEGSLAYVHVYHRGIYLLAVIERDISPLLVIEFLRKLFAILLEYLGEVTEDTLKDDFITVYQLLDEVMDSGYPFTTEPGLLRTLVHNPSVVQKALTATGISATATVADTLPDSYLSNLPWRPEDARHSNNSIYVDIIDFIDCVIDTNGLLASCSVHGDILCNSKLSGRAPEVLLSFSNISIIDDMSLHPCVKYNRFERDRVLSFVPPDGKFKIASFVVSPSACHSVQLPIYVKPQITCDGNTAQVNIMVGPKQQLASSVHLGGALGSGGAGAGPLRDRKMAEDVIVTIHVKTPLMTNSLHPSHGTLHVSSNGRQLRWSIGMLPKEESPILSGTMQCAEASLISVQTVQVNFLVSSLSASNLTVDNLSVKNVEYSKVDRGVRNIVRAGVFEVRV